MSYIPSARKWRPQTFDEIIGQDHVVRSLKNSIERDMVATAFLFSGPRGCGKTSTARILAKTLNCEVASKASGPESTICCNQCTNCKEISASNSLDVMEIDGASNRGIEQIRDLRENVKYSPVHSPYKIYIIDEVHMLTDAAFNALLKTLEEPPEHIKFIFATTEAFKVKLTIRSRCQHYAFRRISIPEIQNQLKVISESLDLNPENKALALLAKYGDGSMRDSESIMDQVIAYAGGNFTIEHIREIFGAPSEEQYLFFIQNLHKKNIEGLLLQVKEISEAGMDLSVFYLGLLEFFRNVLLLQTVPQSFHTLVEVPEDVRQSYEACTGLFTEYQLLELINLLINLNKELKNTVNEKYVVESHIFKMASYPNFISLSGLLKRISDLEAALSTGNLRMIEKKVHNTTNKPTQKEVDEKPKSKTPLKSQKSKNQDPLIPQLKNSKEGAEEDKGEIENSTHTQASTQSLPEDFWDTLSKDVMRDRKVLGTIMNKAIHPKYNPNTNTLHIPFTDNFSMEQIQNTENQQVIKDHLKQRFNIVPKIQVEKTKLAKNIVETALDIFDGKIIT